jgi:membrane fusion protein, multidrug efflux system
VPREIIVHELKLWQYKKKRTRWESLPRLMMRTSSFRNQRVRGGNVCRPRNVTLCVVGMLMLLVSACSEGKTEPPKVNPVVPVTMAAVTQKTIPVHLTAIGNVEAYSTVAIKARVGGELVQVNFKEGQEVNKGDLLFKIDPRPYEATLAEAKARLARDVALLRKAQEDANRYATLIQKQVVSQEQYDQVRANLGSLQAGAKADEATVESARLQMSYCSIYAPISGRTGSLLVDVGNLIKANDDNKSMVVVRQIQPIYVAFSVPEQYLREVKRHWTSEKLKVIATPRDGQGEPLEGELSFIDNTVDTTTGTILFKADFPNGDKSLWPGQFVNVSLLLAFQKDAVIVPSQAIQTGQQGSYVFVVRPDMTVEVRTISSGRIVDGETVVEKGLQVGEKVVTDGQLRLYPNARVDVKNGESAPKPAS